MGQTNSVNSNIIPKTVDSLQIEVLKHSRIISEISSISYKDFQKCLSELNELSKKCLDTGGKQLVFLVKKGTDSSFVWKATVRIACVKVQPATHKIDSYKLLNLKQFLCVFKTFQTHMQSLVSTEEQVRAADDLTASFLIDRIDALSSNLDSFPACQEGNECSICLDRLPEVILPCTHSFCTPCIEQWNVNNKTCPICCQELLSTDDTWVMSEKPGADEISDKICAELMGLSNQIK